MLTIGEFSKLSHISARILRHYDAIGLLRPAYTGSENGYRYYDEAQLANLTKIESLKAYGFSLAQIAELLRLPPDKLAVKIHEQRLKAYGDLHELRKNLRRMEEDIAKMEGTSMVQGNYHVIVMNSPEQRVYCIRRKINISQTHSLFVELEETVKKLGLKRSGAMQQMYLGEEFSYDSMEVEAQMEVMGDAPGVRMIPAGVYAAVTHTGPYETVKYAYDAINRWLQEHPEYRVCGAPIERYLKDETMVDNAEDLETGVLFPVELLQEKT